MPKAKPEDNRAEPPFTIKIVDPKDQKQNKKKRRRTENSEEADRPRESTWPFARLPCGHPRHTTHRNSPPTALVYHLLTGGALPILLGLVLHPAIRARVIVAVRRVDICETLARSAAPSLGAAYATLALSCVGGGAALLAPVPAAVGA